MQRGCRRRDCLLPFTLFSPAARLLASRFLRHGRKPPPEQMRSKRSSLRCAGVGMHHDADGSEGCLLWTQSYHCALPSSPRWPPNLFWQSICRKAIGRTGRQRFRRPGAVSTKNFHGDPLVRGSRVLSSKLRMGISVRQRPRWRPLRNAMRQQRLAAILLLVASAIAPSPSLAGTIHPATPDLWMCRPGERSTSTKTCVVDGDTLWLQGRDF